MPILVKLLGKVILVRLLHLEKAELPILFKLVQLLRSILVRLLQPKKAEEPILVKLLGKVILVSPLQSSKG